MLKNYSEFINEGLIKTDNLKTYEKLLITSIIDFMQDYFNFDTNVTIIKQESKYIGDITLSKKAIAENSFTLNYNPDQYIVLIIESIIHEMTHIKQAVKGELSMSDDAKNLIWKNELVVSVREYNAAARNIKKYKELPWEKEAYENMKKLYSIFLESDFYKSLSGKDATMDYLMKNLR